MKTSKNKNVALPPWKLKGRGYLFIYKIPHKEKVKYLKKPLNDISSSFGMVIIAKYDSSPIGSYDEILFIPSKLNFENEKRYTISKIYVSTKKSVLNGRINWGIPKDIAEFSFKKTGPKTEKITVKKGKKILFKTELKTGNFIFPISTFLFNTSLVQFLNNVIFKFSFRAKGLGKISKVIVLNQDKRIFPDINNKPFLVLNIKKFNMEFNEATKNGYKS